MYTAMKKDNPQSTIRQEPERQQKHTNMPSSLKHEFETKSQCSFDDVKIHYRSGNPTRLGALAYTMGPDVFIAPGEERYLRHELVHVAQQKQNRGSENPILLEQEAERGIIRQIPMADHPLRTIQCRLLTPDNIDEILSVEGHASDSIPQEDKEHICRLAGNVSIINALFSCWATPSPWKIATRIVTIYLESEQQTAKAKLALLDTASKQGALEQVIALLEGKTDENKIIVKGIGGNPEDSVRASVPDILGKLNRQDQQEMLKLMNRLLPLSTAKGVLSVLDGANMNVTTPILWSLLNNEIDEKNQDIFLRRLSLMVHFIEQVAEESVANGKGTSKIKDIYFIESTGSDPHKDGRHALFLVPKAGGERVLYKPRSLQVDHAVAGSGGIMASLSEGSSNEIDPLPSMNFFPVTQQPSKNSLQREQFVHRVGDSEQNAVTRNVAKRFCRQLGELEAIAEVCGLTDLHTDNIIFTKDGPIIIDAECSFIDYSGTVLESSEGPLHRSSNSSYTDMATSVFYYRDKSKIRQSSSIAEDDAELKDAFEQGKNNMLEQLRIMADSGELRAKLDTALNDLDHIRLVPISTNTFAEELDKYLFHKKAGEQEECTKIIHSMQKSITQNFSNKKWLFRSSQNVTFLWMQDAKSTIRKTLQKAFTNGTIPAFYMDRIRTKKTATQKSWKRSKKRKHPTIDIWHIRLDDIDIAEVQWQGTLQTHIIRRIIKNIS